MQRIRFSESETRKYQRERFEPAMIGPFCATPSILREYHEGIVKYQMRAKYYFWKAFRRTMLEVI